MSTTYEDIQKQILDYISDNWTETSVQYPNVHLDVSGLESWIQVNIVPFIANRLLITGSSTNGVIHKGQLVINVFRLANKGTKTAMQYVDDIIDLFREYQMTISGNYKLQFYVPEVDIVGPSGNYWQVTVSIPWEFLD